MSQFGKDVKFMFYTTFHPFDGFYEARFNRKKNYYLITLIYLMCGFIEVLRINYSGFIIKDWNTHDFNNMFVFLSAIFPYIVFAIANWSVTTLFEGSGKISDVLMVLAYASVPKMICSLLGIIISNFIIKEEVIILNSFLLIGTVIFVFLAFAGLCVVHEYSASKTIAMVIATLVSVIIIVFIMLFYVSVIGKILAFLATLGKELLNSISM